MAGLVSNRVSNAWALARFAPELIASLRGMVAQNPLSNRDHLALTADAILRYGERSRDGGSAIAFSLLHGWMRGYVETTGYLVPTCLDIAAAIDRPDLRDYALRLGDWLLQHQRPDGSFPDITRTVSAAFDTGQVLMGLHRLFEETGEPRYAEAGRAAADWLSSLSEPDGSWTRAEDSPGLSRTYFTRSAAALMAFGRLVGEPRYREAGARFLDWTLERQLPSGLFTGSELIPGTPYLLHTIAYVLEGLLQGYEETGEARWLAAVQRGAEALKTVNLEREIILYSYYDAALDPASSEKCVTGLAQWAGLCLRLYAITGDPGYAECASNSLFYVKSKQIQGRTALRGALPGSVPLWGAYLRLAFPNWNLKFFGDALVQWEAMGLDESRQQEDFVMRSHHIYARKVGWTDSSEAFSPFEQRTMAAIDDIAGRHLPAQGAVVLDLGCGAGRGVAWFEARRPAWTFLGVDPIPAEPGRKPVLVGTANRIPLGDASVDMVYAYISLQHVGDIDGALAEIRRVLRPGGLFVVFDRNPISIRGLLKPWHELRGRWIYSWDSPFRERWYTRGAWRRLLRRTGLEVVANRALTDRVGRGVRRLLPINRFVLVAGRKPG